MSLRHRIQRLETLVQDTLGQNATVIDTPTVHAIMGRILTDPQAHEIASSLGTKIMGAGALNDVDIMSLLSDVDGSARNEAVYLYNLIADVRAHRSPLPQT